jgi:hypothetical protein
MSATILLRAESGSSIGRSDCMLHNDSAGKDRGLDTVRSNIRTLPSAIGRSSDSDREDHFLLRLRHALLLESPRKGIICTFAVNARVPKNIYHISAFRCVTGGPSPTLTPLRDDISLIQLLMNLVRLSTQSSVPF